MKTLLVTSKQTKTAGRWDIDFHLPPVGIKSFPKEILAPVRNCADVVKTKRDPTQKPNEAFLYVDIASIDVDPGIILRPQELTGEEAPSRARKVIHAYDIIISSCRPTRGAIAVVPEELHGQICSTGFSVIRAKKGQEILKEKVIGGSLAEGRQTQFVKYLLNSVQPVSERSELVRTPIDDQEFKDGMIRITKGLLFTLHPGFEYRSSTFKAFDVHPRPFDEQLELMAMLKRGQYFERGNGVFQCWRHVEESQGGGVWMLFIYECFGFFVFHAIDSELDCMKPYPRILKPF